ncbi:TetR/AcrR family transcriptional regulator [Streptomyces sp. RGM 3693]|uniref:TetR/AcrR family transcriptional regulator n=1 Tax=Streptomyces sp. RGM 3693 TaxID=3413284 RepID=UPI003D29C48A
MTVIRGARERARSEITEAIKEEARKQLAAEGAAKLSLRAVARALGMASSALYRYFPSRDDLLTALIVDAYDALGAAAEHARDAHPTSAAEPPAAPRRTEGQPESQPEGQPESRTESRRERLPAGTGHSAARARAAERATAQWCAICTAVRDWALAHPHEYALIYGSPVPGYHAPRTTTEPAARVGLTLIGVARDAYAAGLLKEPAEPLPDAVVADALTLGAELGVELPPAVVARLVGAWAQLFGLLSFELFGQFNRVVEARSAFFEQAVLQLASSVGLTGAGPSTSA